MAAGILLGCVPALSQDETFYCEVLSVEGTVYLTSAEVYGKTIHEGDLLKADDEIETTAGSTADLAFDREWSNVTRLEEKSRVKLSSIFPTRLYLDRGALYAKLKSIPKDSTFQVETPTAIAAVRGTEYRTEYADGETQVSNDSEAETSKVYIYPSNGEGRLVGEPTVLPRTQFTGIARDGKPRPPQPMPAAVQQRCQQARGVIDRAVRDNAARGRVGKIQDVRQMEAQGRRMHEEAAQRQKQQPRRRDENSAGGPGNPPGGTGPNDGSGRRGNGAPGEGAPRRFAEDEHGGMAENPEHPMNRPGEGGPGEAQRAARDGNADRPGNRYDFQDPGPRQDAEPPVDQFPGKDIRPAPIHEDRGEGGSGRPERPDLGRPQPGERGRTEALRDSGAARRSGPGKPRAAGPGRPGPRRA